MSLLFLLEELAHFYGRFLRCLIIPNRDLASSYALGRQTVIPGFLSYTGPSGKTGGPVFSIMKALKTGRFCAIVTTSKSLYQTGETTLLIVQTTVYCPNKSDR